MAAPLSITQGTKVALFVILLALASYTLYRLVSKDSRPGATYSVYTRLDDATGLVARSRVKIAGIPVGYIEAIRLEGGRARVDVRVDKGVELFKNGNAAKRSSSLLGEYNLVLTPGTPESPKVTDGGELPSVDTAGTDKIMADLAVIADRVKAVSVQAANAFGTDEGGRQMKEILRNLNDVSREISDTVKENRRAVTESIRTIERITTRSAPKVDNILGNVESVTSDFRDMLEAERLKAPPGSGMSDVRDSLAHLREASRSLDSTLKHADAVVGRVDRGEGTIGRLARDETLIDEVEGVATDIHELTSGLTRIQAIVGLRSEYYVLSNGIKSFVEIRLQPREDKYYLIELISDPRGYTSVTQLDVATTNPNQPAFYRETRTETTNDFRFSFMFARRLGPATFLFGIRESTGGVGVNFHAFDDRLELRSDVFAFGANTRPRVREHVSIEAIKRFWVVLGADDLLNEDRRDFFFGTQLRFTDEDLKSMLPFASFGR